MEPSVQNNNVMDKKKADNTANADSNVTAGDDDKIAAVVKPLQCIFCASSQRLYQTTDNLRRHLVLAHFVEDLCHDFAIDRDHDDDDDDDAGGHSCRLCSSCQNVSLADYLLHLGIGHRKLDAYLPDDLRRQLAA